LDSLGKMTHLFESLIKPSGEFFLYSSASLILIEAYAWHMRVVGLKNTGVPYFSEYANASWIISYASCTDVGSKHGSFEK
jgi:hypothetical protein